MKSDYEKPIAVPLGEAARASGQCNAGSGVGVGSSPPCATGTTVNSEGSGACYNGYATYTDCAEGVYATFWCNPGITPNRGYPR